MQFCHSMAILAFPPAAILLGLPRGISTTWQRRAFVFSLYFQAIADCISSCSLYFFLPFFYCYFFIIYFLFFSGPSFSSLFFNYTRIMINDHNNQHGA